MTTVDMTQAVSGKRFLSVPGATRAAGEITVEVEIVDTRSQFGRVDALVKPVSGSGQMWVSIDRLHIKLAVDKLSKEG
jgi:hypothetical protein